MNLAIDSSRPEHPTSNAQRTQSREGLDTWMLDVGCWMLDVGCWMFSDIEAVHGQPPFGKNRMNCDHEPVRFMESVGGIKTVPWGP
jgi:hypothetical protein